MNKRLLKNITIDFAVLYPIMALYFLNDDLKTYAENALSFIGVACLVVSVCGIFSTDNIAKSLMENGTRKRTRLHTWYGNISSTMEVVVFSMLGWYWVAAGFLLASVVTGIVEDKLQ